MAVFDRLHSKANDDKVFRYAFDLLELDGIDIRKSPLEEREATLRKLLGRRKSGIVYKAHIEGEGAIIFKHACKIRLEGIVSKRCHLSGRVKSWLKIKNLKSPAMFRIEEGTY